MCDSQVLRTIDRLSDVLGLVFALFTTSVMTMIIFMERLPEYRELSQIQRRAVRRRLWRLVLTWSWMREALLVKLLVLLPIAIGLVLLWLVQTYVLRGTMGWVMLTLQLKISLVTALMAWWWLSRRSLPVWRRVIAAEVWGGRARYCLTCGYDLRFCEGDRCVECGASRWVELV